MYPERKMIRLGKLILALPVFAVVSISRNNGTQFLRRLAANCIHNVYATAETVSKIPAVPEPKNEDVPAYIALCQQWIRNDAYHNETDPYDTFRVVEDESICMDWSAPHYAVLDIYAALIVTAQIKRIKYRHNCDRTRQYDEASVGFDHTTIQQILNTPGVGTNKNIFSTENIKQQCRRCLIAYDPQVETVRVKSKAVHHCLAWPKDDNRVLDATALPNSPSPEIGVTAFSSIVTPFRQRMYLSALEWKNVTDNPPSEENSGLVIWIDPTTIGLNYSTVWNEIDSSVTSISILSGPTCATAILPTGQRCDEYAAGLRDYLANLLPALQNNGWRGTAGVSFKITASTAAAISRMVLSKKLLCFPRSPSCYFPALSKNGQLQSALILEDPSWLKAVDFFTIAGTHGVVAVKVLEESAIPNVYTTDTGRRAQAGVPEQFSHVNALVDDEGYPEGLTIPVMPTDSALSQLTDQQILDDIAIALNRFQENPNVHRMRLEIIPTMAMIQEALTQNKPLDVNQVQEALFPKDGNGNGDRQGRDQFRHSELATDADSERVEPVAGVEYWETSTQQRHDSLLRIQSDWATAFYGHIQHTRGEDPSTVYEIACPETTPDGGTVSYLDGKVTTTTPTTIIIADSGGVSVRDAETGAVTATGIENTPEGTAFVLDGGFKVKEAGDMTSARRRTVQLRFSNVGSGFQGALQRVCEKYSKRTDDSLKIIDSDP